MASRISMLHVYVGALIVLVAVPFGLLILSMGDGGEPPDTTPPPEPPTPSPPVRDAHPPLERFACDGGVPAPLPDTTAWPAPPLLWLSSDEGVEVDAAGQVLRWSDRSGNDHEFIPFVAAGMGPAEWLEGGHGCRPAVAFGGRAALIRHDTLGLAPEEGRTFVVVARYEQPSRRAQLFAQSAPRSLRFHMGLEANTFHTRGRLFGAYHLDNAMDAMGAATHRNLAVHTLIIQPAEFERPSAENGAPPPPTAAVTYRQNGKPWPLAITLGHPIAPEARPSLSTTMVGCFHGGLGGCFRGDLHDVLVFRGALADDVVMELEAILAAHHGLSLPLRAKRTTRSPLSPQRQVRSRRR